MGNGKQGKKSTELTMFIIRKQEQTHSYPASIFAHTGKKKGGKNTLEGKKKLFLFFYSAPGKGLWCRGPAFTNASLSLHGSFNTSKNSKFLICLAWNPLHIPTNYFLFSLFSRTPSLFNEEKFREFFPWIDGRHLGVMNFKVIICFQPFWTMGISFWLTFTALRGSQISHIPIRLESDQSCAGLHQGLSQKDKEQMANTELSSPFQSAMEGNVGKRSPSIAYWFLNRTTTCHQPVGMNLC